MADPAAAPKLASHDFKTGDPVEVLIGPGIRRWRRGLVVQVTRARVTVEYVIPRGPVKRQRTVLAKYVRHPQGLERSDEA